MYFHILLPLLLVAAAVQIARLPRKSAASAGEAILVWVLVGYCGIPMMAFMAFGLMHPVEIARLTGFESGSPFQTFVTWALLGMGLSATLALRLRGTYPVGPALSWAVFFLGATGIHLGQYREAGELDHGTALVVFVTHGLVSVILLGALWTARSGKSKSLA